jgi:hypothetical protein
MDDKMLRKVKNELKFVYLKPTGLPPLNIKSLMGSSRPRGGNKKSPKLSFQAFC